MASDLRRWSLSVDAADYPEDSITRACWDHDDNQGDPSYSTFYVSRWMWRGIYTRGHRTLEMMPGGYRIVLVTQYGPVYVVGDKALRDNQIDVVWGSALTYDECIRQGELWMQRAVEMRT